jgi:hypothetical protein
LCKVVSFLPLFVHGRTHNHSSVIGSPSNIATRTLQLCFFDKIPLWKPLEANVCCAHAGQISGNFDANVRRLQKCRGGNCLESYLRLQIWTGTVLYWSLAFLNNKRFFTKFQCVYMCLRHTRIQLDCTH